MIQSGKFDSSDMDIKKLSNTALTFITNRLIEIFGICVLLIGFLILIALISYSPEDPNFIFPDNIIIKNVEKNTNNKSTIIEEQNNFDFDFDDI